MQVKDLVVKAIKATPANKFMKRWHYSGKVVPNSQLHFGVFYKDMLCGVMSFGPSINKKGTINLIKGTGWNEFLELNRLAFTDWLPKNSESRCIGIALRLIKKHTPHIKWIVSFADATQCGHGTIYQASNFILSGVRENTAIRINPATGKPMHIIQAHHLKISSREFRKWRCIKGYQLKYVYLLDKSLKDKLNFDPIPYSYIKENNMAMYKGNKLASVV